MGTNFYYKTRSGGRHDDYEHHIGKRSAAGLYCWDCGVTLCKGGSSMVHSGTSTQFCAESGDNGWHTTCPKCGKAVETETLSNNAAGRELGFNQDPYERKFGVRSCSSFSWAKDPAAVFAKLAKAKRAKSVVDEYGRDYTVAEFQAILTECPIQYTDSIGQRFF